MVPVQPKLMVFLLAAQYSFTSYQLCLASAVLVQQGTTSTSCGANLSGRAMRILIKEILVQDHFYRKYSTITSFFELDTLPSTPDDEPGATLQRVASIVSRG